jgi:uncharacterized phiE125 gp8 family phage protein
MLGVRYEITSAAATLAIATADAKAHLNVEHSDDDDLIEAQVEAAQRVVEEYCNLRLVTQTVKEYFDDFPLSNVVPLHLSLNPVQSISSVTYTDLDGNTTTWDSSLYQTDTIGKPARIMPIYAGEYPDTQDYNLNAVAVTYVAGYGAAADVPKPIRQAILLMVTEMYENRMDKVRQLPMASQRLLDNWRIHTFGA